MLSVGFDKVDIDPMGNIIGTIGSGKHLIACDAHIDTVGVGNVDNWERNPTRDSKTTRSSSAAVPAIRKGGMAAMVYAGSIIKDLGLEKDYTLMMTGTVQEEDCDGLGWQYLIEEGHIRPEFVMSTEPTSCRLHRGQRDRMEIKVAVSGLSAHGSAPERGDNAASVLFVPKDRRMINPYPAFWRSNCRERPRERRSMSQKCCRWRRGSFRRFRWGIRSCGNREACGKNSASMPSISRTTAPIPPVLSRTGPPYWSPHSRKKNGIDTIVVASTGNAGSSMAGIGVAAGQKVILFLPKTGPWVKLIQALQYGATVHRVDGNHDRAYDLSMAYLQAVGGMSRNTAYNPMTIEGKKTVSLELYRQLRQAPGVLFVGTGDGWIVAGVYKGFRDLKQLGVIEKTSRKSSRSSRTHRMPSTGHSKPDDSTTFPPRRWPIPYALMCPATVSMR
jgi:hypothetical protein